MKPVRGVTLRGGSLHICVPSDCSIRIVVEKHVDQFNVREDHATTAVSG